MGLTLTRRAGEAITITSPTGDQVELVADEEKTRWCKVHGNVHRVERHWTTNPQTGIRLKVLRILMRNDDVIDVYLGKTQKRGSASLDQLRMEIIAPDDYVIKRNELIHDGDPSAKLVA